MDLRRQLAVVALVYVIEGYPMGAYSSVFGFYFASQHAALTSIGLLGLLSLAWSLKVVWSPIVERYGTRQQWIAGALIAMAGALSALAWLPPPIPGAPGKDVYPPSPVPADPAALWVALAIYCAASATQDIAIDAYTIGLVDRANLGPANAVRTAAYRVGMLASGSGLLLLPDRFGWDAAFVTGAALSLLLAAALAATPAISLPPASERRPLEALVRWTRRPGVWSVVAFVLLFRIGDKAMGPMVAPFWVERGFGAAEYGTFAGFLGSLLFVVGGVAAGAWMARAGMVRALWVTGALALVSNLVYAATAAHPETGKLTVYIAGALESATSGAVGATFVAFLMSICDRRYAAVEYALLSSLYAAAGAVLAGMSGWITDAVGYAGYFALTAAFAAPAFAFLSRAARWIEPVAEETH